MLGTIFFKGGQMKNKKCLKIRTLKDNPEERMKDIPFKFRHTIFGITFYGDYYPYKPKRVKK